MKVKPNQSDLVFQALASGPRRLIMDLVKQTPGCSVNDICEHFDMSRIGVMKHLAVLVDAQLVISRKKGRTRELFFNLAPIQLIYDRWTDEYSAYWATQAVDLKYQVEQDVSHAVKRRPESKKRARKNKTVTQSKNKKTGNRIK